MDLSDDDKAELLKYLLSAMFSQDSGNKDSPIFDKLIPQQTQVKSKPIDNRFQALREKMARSQEAPEETNADTAGISG